MNKTEAKALRWIAEQTGFETEEIAYSKNRSPDFITPDGYGYEVKQIAQQHRVKSIVLSPEQWRQLDGIPNCFLLLFEDDDEPSLVIKTTFLSCGENRFNDVKITCTVYNKNSTHEDLYNEHLRRFHQLAGEIINLKKREGDKKDKATETAPVAKSK
jgi:hypothetical protein